MDSFTGCHGDELHTHAAPLSWLWHGYLARGRVTLLTSQWKSGKTTLLSVLLSRLQSNALAGLPVSPGQALVVSEEPAAQWELRQRKLHFGRSVYFICRPFTARPTMPEWHALIDHITQYSAANPGQALVVFDTMTTLLPTRAEGNAAQIVDALLPLQRLTALGLCVLLMHHPRKGETRAGQAARGSGALAAIVDIVIEMSTPMGHSPLSPRGRGAGGEGTLDQPADAGSAGVDRRRRLLAFSRFDETPRDLLIELNADGTDYSAIADTAADDFARNWDTLRLVLDDADDRKTRRQLLADWPADFPRPSDVTLYRWLGRAVALNILCMAGSGRKADPFVYWLPHKEALWQQDPLYRLRKQAEEDVRNLRAMGIQI